MTTKPVARRTVLVTGGAIGAAAAIAACGGGGGEASSSTSAAPASPEAAPESSGAAPAPESSEAAPTGEVLGPVDQVAVGSGVVYDGPKVVVTQPAQGDVRGFTAVCPHQGCLVSEVTNNEILCPCHGSLFSAEDGAVLVGPATTGLAPVDVTVVDDQVILS
jgi:Rieske Fe-S protein